MSLGIVIKGPDGLVLAAESRVTLTVETSQGQPIPPVTFDNAKKVLAFDRQSHIGVVTYGLAAIRFRTAQSFVPEFEGKLRPHVVTNDGRVVCDRITVEVFAHKLSEFFMKRWQDAALDDHEGPNMVFIVAGFNDDEPYGRLYVVEIPGNPEPSARHPNLNFDFGMTWGGQRDFVDRLIRGYDHRLPDEITKTLNLSPKKTQAMMTALEPLQMRLPFEVLALQDCVDLAVFFIRTTINAQKLALTLRACGGPIDVATITRSEGLRFIQQKQIVAE